MGGVCAGSLVPPPNDPSEVSLSIWVRAHTVVRPYCEPEAPDRVSGGHGRFFHSLLAAGK